MRPQRQVGQGANQESVRRHNLGTLLRHVHAAGQLSRAELTARMRLNRSTIAGLVAELESLDVISDAATTVRSGVGRPSVGVAVADHGPHVVAVDLGVRGVSAARVHLGGRIEARAHAMITDDTAAWQVGSLVAGLIRDVCESAPTESKLVGIGIGVPGLVRRSDGLVRLAPNLGWQDVSLHSIVLAALGVDVPISLANDGDLGALAEHRLGAGRDVDDVIYLSGNVGVGAGVVAGGVALDGFGGYAGEVGHMRFSDTGQLCHCGNVGCWEIAVGGQAIARAIRCPLDQVAALGSFLKSVDRPTAELRSIGRSLGEGIGSLVNIFNPRMVLMGGYFDPLFTLVREDINEGLHQRTLAAAAETVTLTLPEHGQDSILVGAAELALEPLFADPVTALGMAAVPHFA